MTDASEYWYCLRHHTVEQGPGCPNNVRLGPYDTHDLAAAAPDRAAARTAALDAEEAAENE